jgi:hypothetical protein
MNSFDNKDMYFNPRYGSLGIVILPTATLSIFSSIYLVASAVLNWITIGIEKINQLKTVGLSHEWHWSFDFFYLNTNIIFFITIMALVGMIFLLFASRKMAEGHMKVGLDILYFLGFYAFLAPLWMCKALYNVAFAKNTSWR